MRKLLILALLCPSLSMCQPLSIHGNVINETSEPVTGATVTLKRTGAAVATDDRGEFSFANTYITDSVTVSAVGYETITVATNERGQLTVFLRRKTGLLDEAVIIAYGKTTRRFNTGNVARVTAADIARQPVSNPLSVLEGRVPGLTVVQSSGLPGASVKLQLRGQSSLTQGSEPLFIVDGVPFAPNNNPVNRLSSVLSGGGGGLSPFSSLNPNDIESIEVLKDADATAIWGSRGANGVVLITTKKGKAGKTVFTAGASAGWSKVTRNVPYLKTADYVQMRREAFQNDAAAPTVANAPDLLLWDTTRYTDFTKLLLGGTAHTADAQASVSGGSTGTQFLISGTFHRETTVFPGHLHDTKGSLLSNLSHTSPDQKFTVALSFNYSVEKNNLAAQGLSALANLPPNLPDLYTADGKLAWEGGGASFTNPLSYLLRSYEAKTDNLISRLQVGYRLASGLQFRTSVGYNTINVDEVLLSPLAAQNPATAPKGTAQFGVNRFTSLIVEPQLAYTTSVAEGRLEVLAGGTGQYSLNSGYSIGAGDYTSDALLNSLAAAPTISYRNNTRTEYKYAALFGRLTYSYRGRYIFNLSGRRDASSRFGPGNQAATFGALGGAWIFSGERGLAKALSFLSFGKLRASYGTTGNDQIGDYNYLDAWGVMPAYGGTTALYPTNLFNAAYGWELNKKVEAAVDLGFWADRLLISVAWYRNRSSNQLVQYALPSQTGFTSITNNFPATVQNKGWETEATATPVKSRRFTWNTTANLTLPANRLLSFPGLASSPYAYTYAVGQPLSLIYGLQTTGVDPATGIFTFRDNDKNGSISVPADYGVSGFTAPRWFGGWGNTLSFKGWEAYWYVVFKKQDGATYLNSLYTVGIIPGSMNNQPVYVLNRWRQAGDLSDIQKFTASTASPAYAAGSRFRTSDGVYGDASFARLKTVSVSYGLPAAAVHRLGLTAVRLSLQAQNLITFTAYKGADPEVQSLLALPPLRTVSAGLHLTF